MGEDDHQDVDGDVGLGRLMATNSNSGFFCWITGHDRNPQKEE